MSLSNAITEQFIDFILGNKFAAPVTIDVLSGVATVTSADHGLNIGDFVQIMGAVPDKLRGDKVVASTPDDDSFTYDATGIIDGTATGTIAYKSGLVKVFRGKQDEGSSVKPYIWYRISSSVPIGQSSESFEDTGSELEETTEQTRQIVLELNFHTKTEQQAIDPLETAKDLRLASYISANDLAAQFQSKAMFTRSRAFQNQNGFSVLSVNTISDVDSYVGDRFERRAICELNILVTVCLSESVSFYNPDNLNVTYTIQGL
jgi:hypothetical protein